MPLGNPDAYFDIDISCGLRASQGSEDLAPSGDTITMESGDAITMESGDPITTE